MKCFCSCSKAADLADSNSLARKTDVPKKLSELEIDVEIGGDGYLGVYGDGYIESQGNGRWHISDNECRLRILMRCRHEATGRCI